MTDREQVALEALRAIDAMSAEEYQMPADFSDQIQACPECQRYKGHPIQQGICDTHRRPLWAREAHDNRKYSELTRRRLDVAIDALRCVAGFPTLTPIDKGESI